MNALPSLSGALRAFALPAAAVLLLGACAGQTRSGAGASQSAPAPVKPQVPQLAPTKPPADLSPVERFAWQQVVQLGDAFAAGDVEGFLARVSSGFYRGYGRLESALRALLTGSRARDAVVAIRLVTEEEGRVSVKTEWTRSVTLPDGSVDARHGETVFLFLKSDTSLRLLDYRGDAPFAIAGI
ncbi:MAG: hypothetical protein ACYC9Y_10280 [Candidatus Methylomirabilia bacterium]